LIFGHLSIYLFLALENNIIDKRREHAMKKTTITGILAAAFLLVSACSSHRYTVVEPRKKELTDYPILEIRDFKSNLGDSESKELAARFADRLHQKVMQDRQEHPDEVIFDDVVRGINKTEGVLLLDGTIAPYSLSLQTKLQTNRY
jgi:hypothetical protein